jgi:hypothetical protein
MGDTVEPVATDAVPISQVFRDGVLRGMFWQGAVKRGIEDCNHGDGGVQNLPGGAYCRQRRPVVQGR